MIFYTSLRMSLSQSHLILEICSWCCWCSTRRSPAFILSAWIILLRASSVCFLHAFSSAISCRSFTLSWSKKRRASSLASRVSAVRTWNSGRGAGGESCWHGLKEFPKKASQDWDHMGKSSDSLLLFSSNLTSQIRWNIVHYMTATSFKVLACV